jgi:hypothetical protein
MGHCEGETASAEQDFRTQTGTPLGVELWDRQVEIDRTVEESEDGERLRRVDPQFPSWQDRMSRTATHDTTLQATTKSSANPVCDCHMTRRFTTLIRS